jgi:hypothetical protein
MRGERIRLTVWAVVGAMALLGCGGSDNALPSGSGGRGGAGGGISLGGGGKGGTATGGAGGTATGGAGGTATGGAGGASDVRPECQTPDCFKALAAGSLLADCQPMGTCMQQEAASGAVNICWANGVRETVSVDFGGTGAAVATAEVRSKNGALCFSFDFSIDPTTGDVGAITVRDSSGKVVGTLEGNLDGSVSATCTGQPAKIIPASCGMNMGTMMPGMNASTMCTPGVCQ